MAASLDPSILDVRWLPHCSLQVSPELSSARSSCRGSLAEHVEEPFHRHCPEEEEEGWCQVAVGDEGCPVTGPKM